MAHDIKCDGHLSIAVTLAVELFDALEQLHDWGHARGEQQVTVHMEGADTRYISFDCLRLKTAASE